MSLTAFVKNNLTEQVFNHVAEHYNGASVTVTGGASFIGSSLVDVLIDMGAFVTVVDDFSSGKRSFVQDHANLTLRECDLRYLDLAEKVIGKSKTVFHLAAIHGGRGFIETQHKAMLANFAIDNNVFSCAVKNEVGIIVHASSACAYPINLQASELELNQLREDMASMEDSEKSFPDGVYGWTKLGGEYQLQNSIEKSSTKGRSARIFTAYGERENESHAAIALAAKALLHADPYPIWGSGEQTRNFTYVGDTVTGLLLLGSDAGEKGFDVFNIGTADHIRVIDFVKEIFDQIDWNPKVLDLQIDKPVGVASRASDNTKLLKTFGWAPTTSITEGIQRTLAWYKELPDRPRTLEQLERLLMAR